ncbi:DUF124 domain-containing protein, partial [hydrothermal vent metagenome]
HLDAGESIQTEGGAMVSMDSGITIETKAKGGILKSLGRSVFGGESFFMNTYRTETGGTIRLAPSLPGDMMVLDIHPETPIKLQSGGYIASTEGVEIDTKWSGSKTFFASEGAIMLGISGRGQLVMASFGALDEWTLGPGETYTVDTGHLVSMTADIGFKVRKVGNWKSTLFSGEGLVVDLTGPGTFTTQSRSQDAFLSWLIPRLPSSNTSSA